MLLRGATALFLSASLFTLRSQRDRYVNAPLLRRRGSWLLPSGVLKVCHWVKVAPAGGEAWLTNGSHGRSHYREHLVLLTQAQLNAGRRWEGGVPPIHLCTSSTCSLSESKRRTRRSLVSHRLRPARYFSPDRSVL